MSGEGSPSETLWWALEFLIQRASLDTLRSLHRRLVDTGTTSAVRGKTEDEITRRTGGPP